MRSFDATQTAIAASAHKRLKILFDVTLSGSASVDYYWSTQSFTYLTQAYTFKIDPESFSGVTLQKDSSEMGIAPPNTCEFSIVNASGALSADDFTDADVLIKYVLSDGTNEEVMRSFKMQIKRAFGRYGEIDCECEDFFQQYLEKDWPTTPLVSSLFPSTLTTTELSETAASYNERPKDNLCVPETFGTAYVPLRCLYIGTDRKYVLGKSTRTFTVSEVHHPDVADPKYRNTKWLSSANMFTQANATDTPTSTSWKTLAPIIADANSDGTNDAIGVWSDGTGLKDMPAKFSNTTTAGTTNPADVISWILQDAGVDSGDIDTSAAATTFTGWGLEFEFGAYTKAPLRDLLGQLLILCNAYIVVTDKVELHVYSKTAVGTDFDTTTCRYFDASPLEKAENDSGYIIYRASADVPETYGVKCVVPAGSSGTTDNPASDEINAIPMPSSVSFQRAGILHYFRKFKRQHTVSMSSGFGKIAHDPGDVVRIDDARYGGTYSVMIEAITFGSTKSDTPMAFDAVRYDGTLEDWTDFTPATITPATDTGTDIWSPVIAGPDSVGADTGSIIPNTLYGRLKILNTADVNDYIYMDPTETVIRLVSDSATMVTMGQVSSGVYGLQVKDKDGLTVFQADDTAVATIAGWSITDTLIRSAESGARIQLDKTKNRISIFDATAEKVAMGYLDGLAKNDGTGNYSSSDYGFWVVAGDTLVIDGGVDYVAGSWLIQDDASVKIFNATDDEVIRLGTDSGEKGLWLYNPTTGYPILKCGTDGTDAGLYLYADDSGGALLASYADTGVNIYDGGDITINDGGDLIFSTPIGGVSGISWVYDGSQKSVLNYTVSTDPESLTTGLTWDFSDNTDRSVGLYMIKEHTDPSVSSHALNITSKLITSAAGSSLDTSALTSKSVAAPAFGKNITGVVHGIRGLTFHDGAGEVSYMVGTRTFVTFRSTGTATVARGVYATASQTTSGGPVTYFGVQSGGHIGSSTNYGFYASEFLSGSTNYGLYITGEDRNYLSGKLSVGTNSTNHMLYVLANDSTYVGHFQQQNTSGHGVRIKLGMSVPTSSNWWMAYLNSADTALGGIRGDGAGGATFWSASDRRIKTDIHTLDPVGAWDAIRLSRPIGFRHIESGKYQEGFVAQELYEANPLWASKPADEKKELWQISKIEMIPAMVSVIQQLQDRVERLERN